MAWIYQMAAEFGDDRSAAEACAVVVDGNRHVVTDGAGFETVVLTSVLAGQSGRWWLVLTPAGLSTSGITEAERMTKVGGILFEILRHLSGYRFATVGLEAFDFRDLEDLPSIIDSDSLHGFVLSEEVFRALSTPMGFVPFAPGYRWKPYRGESARSNSL
jgi:hypothetical protein